MAERVHPYLLTWDEVDPERHPFDPAEAHAVVRAFGAAHPVPERPGHKDVHASIEWARAHARVWTDELTAALVEHYGPWVSGWRWAPDEGDIGGGPVGGWCCPRHSVFGEATLDVVAGCVIEWREWLEELAERFARFPVRQVPPEDRELMWERAAVHLITQVMDRTGVGDTWYSTVAMVLRWYLTSGGVSRDDAARLVERAIGGRFESWSPPKPGLIDDMGERLAAGLIRLEGDDA